MEERIIKLETLSALQDETINSLNEEVFRQQQDLVRLQRQLERLESKLEEMENAHEIGGNERPPHY
ncbi:SlyX family protein [Pontiella sp.]|uniref:SlyX family protein n=1 Tax=Pontiella sp. TaxID=2837462 RepID=UPI0035626AB6